ncbi:hypothetical protein A9Q87_04915 [Flavobacteriales bacterium 34_180_T64]|nr:hypothetical protein A9Q87_04915 [Flavobacteriales bacterium 34_180_T64]
MVLNSIEKLLEKYDNCETSLKEEQKLKAYFAQEEVAPHLESYRVMFQYFNNTKQELYTKDVPLKPRRNYIYQWISVAAVAVLMFSVFTQINKPVEPTQEQLLAYNQTMEALNLVSSKFNQGTQQMGAFNLVSSNLNKGTESMAYVGEFGKTTNKIFKNK